MSSTNYYDAFIAIATDCRAAGGIVPPQPKAGAAASVARRQFDLIMSEPYRFTSDEVIFTVFADRNGIPDDQRQTAWAAFFGKGQPCLRASALGKQYGWGVHSDAQGRVALHAVGSAEYRRLADDPKVAHTTAMRSRRA